MGNRRAHTLIDEIGPALEHRADKFIGIPDQDGIGLMTVILKEKVNHREHTQQAQVVLNMLEEIRQIAVGEMTAHQLVDSRYRRVIGHIALGELGAYLVLVGTRQSFGQWGKFPLGIPVLQRILHHAVKGCQGVTQPGQSLINGGIHALDRLVHRLLEAAYLGEVVRETALLVHRPQIGADLVHPGAEELAIDLLGELVQAAAVVEESPILFLGLAAYHVTLVVLDPLVELGGFGLVAQRQQEVVNRHPHGIVLVKLDVVVEIAVQLPCKVAQDGLEKRVDGAHVEVAVVKQQLVQRLASQHPHRCLVKLGFLHEILQVIALDARLRQAIQLGDNALLHLVGRLVGKCDGQQVTVSIERAAVARCTPRHQVVTVLTRGEQQVPDVFQGETVGLARASRSLYHQQVMPIVFVFLHDGMP